MGHLGSDEPACCQDKQYGHILLPCRHTAKRARLPDLEIQRQPAPAQLHLISLSALSESLVTLSACTALSIFIVIISFFLFSLPCYKFYGITLFYKSQWCKLCVVILNNLPYTIQNAFSLVILASP